MFRYGLYFNREMNSTFNISVKGFERKDEGNLE